MNHPIVDSFASDAQGLCELFNGQLSTASFSDDIRIKQL